MDTTPEEPIIGLAKDNSAFWQYLGVELVYTQTRCGKYLSFYWQMASAYDLKLEEIVDSTIEDIFIPIAKEAYVEKITRVLERRIPEQCYWRFEYLGQSLPFELAISPILPREGEPNSVLVMGHLVKKLEVYPSSYSNLTTYSDPYQKLLTNIVRKIRTTLDLKKIWQETVDGLGETLKVSRCLLIYCNPQKKQLEVKAEYCQASFEPLIGAELELDVLPYLKQAIFSKEPAIIEKMTPGAFGEYAVLALSTFYQDQRNGIICLLHCLKLDGQTEQPSYYWSQLEIDLVQKIADQVGTAIAHATLYNEIEQARKEAEEASRRKTEFLANTTHELRTPLSSIIGFLKLILDGMADDPEEQEEFVRQAYNSSLYLLNLINDILNIAKIEAGKMDLNLGPVCLNEVFQDVEKFTRTQAEEKNINFNIVLPATYDNIIVYSNYQRLLQVMLNLVSNSIKFTHKGGIKISAEVLQKAVKHQDLELPGMVKISVADTGIGVPLDKQDKLFESFFQTDGSRTKSYVGTGLGLSISKKLVEAMGGQIFFYSMGEKLGATVTFTVPLYHIPVMKTVEPSTYESIEFII